MTHGARSPAGLRLAVLAGDGIGPEIVPTAVAAADAALAACGAGPVEWLDLPMGRSAIESHGTPLPATTLDALAGVDGWLLGPHDSAAYPDPHRTALNPSGAIRRHFQLFANVRPAVALAGTPATVPGMDLVVVRENTQGFYADRNTHRGTGELMPTPDVAMSVSVVTRPAVERIVRLAFELAQSRRRHLTVVHKANVLPLTTGMFLEVVRRAGGRPPLGRRRRRARRRHDRPPGAARGGLRRDRHREHAGRHPL